MPSSQNSRSVDYNKVRKKTENTRAFLAVASRSINIPTEFEMKSFDRISQELKICIPCFNTNRKFDVTCILQVLKY